MEELKSENIENDSKEGVKQNVLCIEKVVGGYAGTLGLQKLDVIVGIDGERFYGTSQEFNAIFDFEEEETISCTRFVLTVARGEILFNLIAEMRIICAFEEIEDPFISPSEILAQQLENANRTDLSNYLLFHDKYKNAEVVIQSRSLTAMVAPPLWLLNQRMPEAALAAVLGILITTMVHPTLGAIFYFILCFHVGREQMNLTLNFMAFKKFLFKQTIAGVNELEVQETALKLHNDLHFTLPANGLLQIKNKNRTAKSNKVTRSAA
ncbi:MAG: hypothetical protein CML56_05575 [Rhodobacteraceae bacterium]|nr:hypothetical protein [Paracoccaceae bacterium]